jgi:hypothetical protein
MKRKTTAKRQGRGQDWKRSGTRFYVDIPDGRGGTTSAG